MLEAVRGSAQGAQIRLLSYNEWLQLSLKRSLDNGLFSTLIHLRTQVSQHLQDP